MGTFDEKNVRSDVPINETWRVFVVYDWVFFTWASINDCICIHEDVLLAVIKFGKRYM